MYLLLCSSQSSVVLLSREVYCYFQRICTCVKSILEHLVPELSDSWKSWLLTIFRDNMALPSTLEELMEFLREKIHPAESEDKETVDSYYKLAFSASMINHMTVTVDSESKSEFQPLTCTELIKFLLLEFLLRQKPTCKPKHSKITAVFWSTHMQK